MTELIYNKTVKFKTEEGEHVYSVQKLVDRQKKLWTTETPVLGVTTVMNIIDKPALVSWSANLAAAYMREHGVGLSEPKLKRLEQEAKRQHIEAGNKGKAAGSVGHALIEALLTAQEPVIPTQPEAKAQAESVMRAFKAWVVDFEPDILAQEKACYSLVHNYAGKFDLLCEIDGKIVLVDFKTTNSNRYNPDGIYGSYFGQLGAYIQLIEEQLGVEVDDAMIVNLPKDGSNYKLKSLLELGLTQAEAKMYFLNALGLYQLNNTFNNKVKG